LTLFWFFRTDWTDHKQFKLCGRQRTTYTGPEHGQHSFAADENFRHVREDLRIEPVMF